MSSANAAARKRRTAPVPDPVQLQQQLQQQRSMPIPPGQIPTGGPPGLAGQGLAGQGLASPNTPTTGLTLQQVINVLDKRITNIEGTVIDIKNQPTQNSPTPTTDIQPYLDEFNSRFELIADEITNLKNIVLSLQSYTMDVNKILMEERIQILSEVSNTITEQPIDEEEPLDPTTESTNELTDDPNVTYQLGSNDAE